MESNSFVVLADILSCVATSPTNQSRTSSRTSCTRTARTSTWKLSSCIGMVIGPISIISLLIRPRCISIFLVMISFRSTNLCIISACAALIVDNVFFLFFLTRLYRMFWHLSFHVLICRKYCISRSIRFYYDIKIIRTQLLLKFNWYIYNDFLHIWVTSRIKNKCAIMRLYTCTKRYKIK